MKTFAVFDSVSMARIGRGSTLAVLCLQPGVMKIRARGPGNGRGRGTRRTGDQRPPHPAKKTQRRSHSEVHPIGVLFSILG